MPSRQPNVTPSTDPVVFATAIAHLFADMPILICPLAQGNVMMMHDQGGLARWSQITWYSQQHATLSVPRAFSMTLCAGDSGLL